MTRDCGVLCWWERNVDLSFCHCLCMSCSGIVLSEDLLHEISLLIGVENVIALN